MASRALIGAALPFASTASSDPNAKRPAQASLLSDAILTGTEHHDRAGLAAAIQALGADVGVGVNSDRFQLSGSTLATKDAVDPIIHRAYLAELVEAYLPPDVDRKDPRVSSLYADLAGFPPTLIQVGACETLLADSTRFAATAGTANVAVTLEIWPDMIHAWPMWNAHLEPGRRALTNAGEFIRRHL